jgi:hypothetical protein
MIPQRCGPSRNWAWRTASKGGLCRFWADVVAPRVQSGSLIVAHATPSAPSWNAPGRYLSGERVCKRSTGAPSLHSWWQSLEPKLDVTDDPGLS